MFHGKKLIYKIEGLNECIDTWCSKHGINKSLHMEWKGNVINRLIKNKHFVQQNVFTTS